MGGSSTSRRAAANRVRLSVMVPMYDEEAVLPAFLSRLRPVLDGLGVDYEVACVDDGSRDRTAGTVMEAAQTWPELRLIRLLRNSGHQAALTCGFAGARGDYVVTIDADLQDPPEVIASMLETAEDATRTDAADPRRPFLWSLCAFSCRSAADWEDLALIEGEEARCACWSSRTRSSWPWGCVAGWRPRDSPSTSR